jgi:2'-5' RNA ligase
MKTRSFIAVDPSPEVLARIAGVIKKLEPQTHGFRWVGPDGIHLTLRFLGGLEEETLLKIQERLEQLAGGESTISLSASGMGFFPDPLRPRVVWVGLSGETDRLKTLQSKVDEVVREAVRDLPVHEEKGRNFTPHLTVARIPDFRKASGVAQVLAEAKRSEFGPFPVDSLILYKSDLTPGGARYTKLKSFKLGRT